MFRDTFAVELLLIGVPIDQVSPTSSWNQNGTTLY
jgi:hypothetical protein